MAEAVRKQGIARNRLTDEIWEQVEDLYERILDTFDARAAEYSLHNCAKILQEEAPDRAVDELERP